MASELSREEDEEVRVDFEKGEIVVIKKSRYRLWHDFGPVKRFFVYAEPDYIKYIEKRPEGLYLVVSDLEKGVEEEPISEEEARELVADAAKHWVGHYEWCE